MKCLEISSQKFLEPPSCFNADCRRARELGEGFHVAAAVFGTKTRAP